MLAITTTHSYAMMTCILSHSAYLYSCPRHAVLSCFSRTAGAGPMQVLPALVQLACFHLKGRLGQEPLEPGLSAQHVRFRLHARAQTCQCNPTKIGATSTGREGMDVPACCNPVRWLDRILTTCARTYGTYLSRNENEQFHVHTQEMPLHKRVQIFQLTLLRQCC